MKIIKKESGVEVELKYDLIKKYATYNLYQVSKKVHGVYIPVYKETLTKLQMDRIRHKNYVIEEDEE